MVGYANLAADFHPSLTAIVSRIKMSTLKLNSRILTNSLIQGENTCKHLTTIRTWNRLTQAFLI